MSALTLQLIADANSLIKGLQAAQAQVDQFTRAAGEAGQTLGGGINRALSAFRGLAGGGAAAAGVLAGAFVAAAAAGTALALSTARQAEELEQLSDLTGINTDTLQEYDVLLSRVGGSVDDVAVMMKTLSRNVEEAKTGTGHAADRFRQLGIDITKISGTDDLIRKIADAMAQMANGTDKAAIGSELIGKSWTKLAPVFEGGSQAIDAAARASRQLGDTLSAFQLGVLSTMDTAVDDLGIAWKRFGQQVGAFVAPAVEAVSNALTALLAIGSHVFRALNVAADTLAIRLLHVGLAAEEVVSVLFSSSVLSGDAWKQTAENLRLIDAEAAKLIAKRRAIDAIGAPPELRAPPPAVIDTAKLSQQQQALIDAQIKASDAGFKQEAALQQARLANWLATLEAAQAAGIRTDDEVATARQSALAEMDGFTVESLRRQLSNYEAFVAAKAKLFTADDKGAADRAKFTVEAAQRQLDLANQLAVATVAADTTRIQSGAAVLAAAKATRLQPLDDEVAKYAALEAAQAQLFATEGALFGASDAARRVRFALIDAEADRQRVVIEQTIAGESRKAQAILNLEEQVDARRRQAIASFPSFFEQQMSALVASNAFSVGQIVSTWTSGLANAVVTGGNFVKAAWQSTQVAILQGVLNTGVQLAAQWALQASVEMGILTAKEAAKFGLKATSEAAQTAAAIAGAEARVAVTQAEAIQEQGIMLGAQATILGMFATVGSALKLMFLEVLVPAVVAVGAFVMGVLSAIASALTATVFGIPFAGAILLGVVAIAAALAATGNLGFKDGGIGDFGSGTPATLHGPEAIIPLNSRGAAFMQSAFGRGGREQQTIHTHVHLNGREMALAISDAQPGALRTMGAF